MSLFFITFCLLFYSLFILLCCYLLYVAIATLIAIVDTLLLPGVWISHNLNVTITEAAAYPNALCTAPVFPLV